MCCRWDDHDAPWLWYVIAIAFCVVCIALLMHCQNTRKEECRKRGGRVVDVHGTRDAGWFCDEKPTAEREP